MRRAPLTRALAASRKLRSRRRLRPSGESLERRTLLAFNPELLADIYVGSLPSNPSYFVEMGGVQYFTADDGVHGVELWKSDGTAAGTTLVRDIAPGSASSYPSNLTAHGSTLFFSAADATNGRELWKSDGTAAGTVLVRDIAPGSASSYPGNLTALGSTLFFTASDATNGDELWTSDGTAAGTTLVKDIFPGNLNGLPQFLTVMGSSVYFAANVNGTDRELWKSDGTAAGTTLVKDLWSGSTGSYPGNLTVIGSTLYFSAEDPTNGRELWRSDGTAAGTTLVKNIRTGSSHSSPEALKAVGSTLFFLAEESATGKELWKSDGTAAGTTLVKDVNPGAGSILPLSYPQLLVPVNGALMFAADNGTNGVELWRSDGTAAGTTLVKDIQPGSASAISKFVNLAAAGNVLFFAANDGVSGTELWVSDGTSAGTTLVEDIAAGASSSSPEGLTQVGTSLIFRAVTAEAGREPWVLSLVQNDPPTAGDDIVGVLEDQAVVINVLANDSDPNLDALTITSATTPSHGAAVINRNGTPSDPGDDFILYTPAPDYYGTDSFTYTIVDGKGGSADATVTVTVAGVNDAPVAYDDAAPTDEDQPLVLTQATLLANDTDVDNTGAELTITAVGSPINGTVVLNADGTITFTPNPDFFGIAGFRYTLSDGSLVNVPSGDHAGLVTVAVRSVNDAPVAGDDSATAAEDGAVTIDPRANDSGGPANETAQTLSVTGVTQGAHGTVTFTASGVTYTPDADYNGGDTFTYTVTDDGTSNGFADPKSSTATVNVSVTAVNDAPSFTPGGDVSVVEDSYTYSAPWATGLSAGPADEVGQALSFQISGNTNPGLFSTGPAISPTGVLTFHPRAGTNGSATITVVLRDDGGTDGGGVDSVSRTFAITVEPSTAPFASFSLASQSVAESAGSVTLLVQLDRPAPADLFVPVGVEGSLSAQDIALSSPSVLIPAGETSGSMAVAIVNDALDEFDEEFTAEIGATPWVRRGAQVTQVLTILDDDETPTVAFSTGSQQVGESVGTVFVGARLSAISGRDVTIPILLSGSATAGDDYTTVAGSIVIHAGAPGGSLRLAIEDDTLPEGSETIIATMGTPDHATRSTELGSWVTQVVTIAASDAPTVSFTASQWDFLEKDDAATPANETTYTLRARLSAPTPLPVTIPLEIDPAGGTAGAPGDFSMPWSSIVIPAGASEGSMPIVASNDLVGEPLESFRIKMGTVLNATPSGTTSFLGRILANDKPTIAFVSSTSSVWEDYGSSGTVLTISARLSNPSSTPLSVPVQVVGGSLVTYDYAFTDAVFDFPGDSATTTATVTVSIAKDVTNEASESFTVQFFPTTAVYVSSAKGTHTVTIMDNDPYVSFNPISLGFLGGGIRFWSSLDQYFYGVSTPNAVRQTASEGVGTASGTIYLSSPSNLTVTLPISYSGQATKGKDYTGPASVSILPGSTSGALQMPIIQDTVWENYQVFTATIGQPRPGDYFVVSSYPSQLVTMIDDDDAATVNFTATSRTVKESAGNVLVTVSLSTKSEVPVKVPITLTGTARRGSDYAITAPSGVTSSKFNVTLPANLSANPTATITIKVTNDKVWDERSTETVVLTMGKPSGAALGRKKTYTLSITNDDPVPKPKPPAYPAGTVAIDTTGGGGEGIILASPGSYSPIDSGPLPGPLQAGQISLFLGVGGYVDGALGFFDANKNGVLDFLDLDGDGLQGEDEPSEVAAIAQPDGRFAMIIPEAFDRNGDTFITPEEGQLVLVGGIDSASGLPMTAPLIAPGGSFVVSPFTSIMSALVEDHEMSLEQSAARVREALRLPVDVDLTRFDPIAATLGGFAEGAFVFAADSQVTDTVEQVKGLIGGSTPGVPADFLARVAYADIAAKLAEDGAILDLSEPAVVEAVIQGVLYETGIALDSSKIEAAAKVIAEGNQRIDATEKVADETFLGAMSKSQKAAQGLVAAKLADLGAGLSTATEVLDATTGQALTDLIAATTAGDVVPTAIAIADVRLVESNAGSVLYEFTVELDRPSTQPVSVHYHTADSTATLDGGDYDAASGVLTWAAGDTSSRTVQVIVHGDAAFEGDEEFLVFLSEVENAMLARGVAVGTIGDDDPLVYNAPADNGDNQLHLSIERGFVTLDRNDEVVFAGELSTPVPITILGANGVANSLRVDLFDAGDFLDAGISFAGGDGASDSLTVLEGTVSTVSHVRGQAGAGTLTIDDAPIHFTGVESVTDLIASGIDGLSPSYEEGASLDVTARPGDPDSASLLSHAWSLTRNGLPYATGSGESFTGALGDDGDYEVTVTATNTDNGAVGITVASFVVVNAPPTAVVDTASTSEDQAATITVLANDSDPAGADDPLIVSEVGQGAHGSVALNPDGTLSYTPAPHYSGTDSFTYAVSDGDGGSSTATVDVTIAAVADGPTLAASSPGGAEGSPISVVISPALVDTDGSEVLLPIRVRGVPAGATFNHGSRLGTYQGYDEWSLTAADLPGLTLTVPDGPIGVELTITVFARETLNLDTAETSAPLSFPVANVAPTATFVAPASASEGSPVTLSLTDAQDPSTADGAAGFLYAFDTGGGYGAFGPNHEISFTPTDSGTLVVKAKVRDQDGDATEYQATLAVENLSPVASIAGASSGVRGQARSFTLSASDASTDDAGAGFTYLINWGDGSPSQTIAATPGNGGGVTVDHVFSTEGTFTVRVSASDHDGGVSEEAPLGVDISVAAIQADWLDPTKWVLVVGGTSGADILKLKPGNDAGEVKVVIRDEEQELFYRSTFDPPINRIVVYGQAGDDEIAVKPDVRVPSWLYGDDGDDRLKGGVASDVLLGGAGDDLLTTNGGGDILIGGLGADKLVGDRGDDLLIAGTTAFDTFDAAIAAIRAEWTSGRSYATRVANLRGNGTGTRLNGTYFLIVDGPNRTVFDDEVKDIVTGGSGKDWFLLNLDGDGEAAKKDKATDRSASEFLDDLDFILGA